VGDLRKILPNIKESEKCGTSDLVTTTQVVETRNYLWKDAYPLIAQNYKAKTLSPQEAIF
jgi:hypothetical protein